MIMPRLSHSSQAEIEQIVAEKIAAEEAARAEAERIAAEQAAAEEAANADYNNDDAGDYDYDSDSYETENGDYGYTGDGGSNDDNVEYDGGYTESGSGYEENNESDVSGGGYSESESSTGSGESASTGNTSGSGSGSSVVNYATQFVGNPYVWGGTSLTNGADCSGFVQSVYSNFGVSLPRTSYEQQNVGREVSYSDAQPGDLICYGGHVAIYMGNGKIVHASNSRDGIKVSDNAAYRTILSVRRLV